MLCAVSAALGQRQSCGQSHTESAAGEDRAPEVVHEGGLTMKYILSEINDTLIEILKELKKIRAHLEVVTGKDFKAGKRFNF